MLSIIHRILIKNVIENQIIQLKFTELHPPASSPDTRLQTLVIAPTREIAVQIRDVIIAISKSSMPEVKTHAFIGGMSTKDDVAKLRGGGGGSDSRPHIAVGTPGRIKV